MRPVNLIPPEDRRGDHAPLRAGIASYAIVAVLALALVGVVLVVMTNNDISDSEAELASLEARQAQADLEAAELAPYAEFATLEQARSQTVSDLAQSRFDWERVLNELALVIPRRVQLETMTGTVGAGVAVSGATSAPTSTAGIAGPSLEIIGCAMGQKGTARLLAALRDIDGVTRVGMQSSVLGEEAAAPTSGVTDEATSAGGAASGCQVRPEIAKFQVSVAFDAVPPPPTATAPSATPAAATATAEDGGVAEAEATQQGVEDSAADQQAEVGSVADAVGVGN